MGEIPVFSGRLRSFIVWTFDGGSYWMCFTGVKSPEAILSADTGSMTGFQLAGMIPAGMRPSVVSIFIAGEEGHYKVVI